MPSSSELIQKDLETLISSQYTLPPKQFAQEEIAVKQAMQKLLHVLAQPAEQHSLLSTISIEAIENMTRRGQLTLVAKNLDDSFLQSVESVLKKTNIEFEKDGQKIVLSDLYKRCCAKLTNEKGKEPNFGDVLLRMYTEESPFFKKLNAIVGGYNDPKTTTDDEIKLALLLNVAIHKAGLDKRTRELQQTPEQLYRGQSFGLDNFVKKFEKITELQAQGRLTTLSPAELAEINIVDIAAKKILSTTTDLKVTAGFAKSTGVVLHIKNPEKLADFYNVANISEFANEAEYISRIPDDIAMIPISITKDTKGVNHIEVLCIHSENVLLHNSTRIYDIRESLKDYINNEIYQSTGYFTSYFDSEALNQKQMNLMEQLITIINESEEIEMLDIAKQDEFLQSAFLTLNELYKTEPTEYQKEGIDTINIMLQNYAAVVTNVKVVHETYHSRDIIAQEQKILNANLDGKRLWIASIEGKAEEVIVAPIIGDLNKLLDSASSPKDMREAATNILESMKNNVDIESKFSSLKANINEIIGSLDKIEIHQQVLQSKPEKLPPSLHFKLGIQQHKEEALANKNAHEEELDYHSKGMSV